MNDLPVNEGLERTSCLEQTEQLIFTLELPTGANPNTGVQKMVSVNLSKLPTSPANDPMTLTWESYATATAVARC